MIAYSAALQIFLFTPQLAHADEETNRIISLHELADLLAFPPCVQDAVFTKRGRSQSGPSTFRYYRCSWSTNGFFIASADKLRDLQLLDTTKVVFGKAGNLVWKTGGGTLMVADLTTETSGIIEKNIGDYRSWERMAFLPLSFGILPLQPGNPLEFNDDSFEGLDYQQQTLKGHVTLKNALDARIDYTVANFPDVSYASTVNLSISGTNIDIPIWKFTEAVRNDRTNHIASDLNVIYCKRSPVMLPIDYFKPANLLKKSRFPLVIGILKSNEVVTVSDGKVVAKSGAAAAARQGSPSLAILFTVGIVLAVLAKLLVFRRTDRK